MKSLYLAIKISSLTLDTTLELYKLTKLVQDSQQDKDQIHILLCDNGHQHISLFKALTLLGAWHGRQLPKKYGKGASKRCKTLDQMQILCPLIVVLLVKYMMHNTIVMTYSWVLKGILVASQPHHVHISFHCAHSLLKHTVDNIHCFQWQLKLQFCHCPI